MPKNKNIKNKKKSKKKDWLQKNKASENNIQTEKVNEASNKKQQKSNTVASTKKSEFSLEQLKTNLTLLAETLSRVEFCRTSYALYPKENDQDKGLACINVRPNKFYLWCNCQMNAKFNKCEHKVILKWLVLENILLNNGLNYEAYKASYLYKLAIKFEEIIPVNVDGVRVEEKNGLLLIRKKQNRLLMTYYGKMEKDIALAYDRLNDNSEYEAIQTRKQILNEFTNTSFTDSERAIMKAGMTTVNIKAALSAWTRIFYHFYVSFGTHLLFIPKKDTKTNTVKLDIYSGKSKLAELPLPTGRVDLLLKLIQDQIIEDESNIIAIQSAIPLLKIEKNNDNELTVTPYIQITNKNASNEIHFPTEFKKIYIGKVMNIDNIGLVEIQVPPGGKFPEFIKQRITGEKIPAFLNDYHELIHYEGAEVQKEVREMAVFDDLPELSIEADAIDRDWCYLSLSYPLGKSNINIYELLQKRAKQKEYIKMNNGWLDMRSNKINTILDYAQSFIEGMKTGKNKVKMPKIRLFKLAALSQKLNMHGKAAKKLQKMLNLAPYRDVNMNIEGMNGELRHYQEDGLKWLLFLAENDFGGLLCDDMGLGKTHQAMALMLIFRNTLKRKKHFMVVCPTSVLPHWESKIKKYAPVLKAKIYHEERELKSALKNCDVLLTSYGILRNDIEKLKKINFDLIFFDEIQMLKNKNTLSYGAALQLKPTINIGLTGTPIENSLTELKALMDIVLPDYLDDDKKFAETIITPIEQHKNQSVKKLLNRLITPFILRRLKSTVLDELPPKIEDIRYCELSNEQISLYRQAIATRGNHLIDELKDGKGKIPYMHIFALLDMLKQICNHPALATKQIEKYDTIKSGKWELFKEILSEVIESKHKIVIFTQYLGMVDMMERYLKSLKIGYVSLTGASRNRGEIVRKFNEEKECRVFIGSLKAGGTGIDLIAASIVIHYDRWWNAAKEDQATDRVHRIGQTRGVQVFKFISTGTLEEKIDAIISSKRNLMDEIVKEDSDRLKSFSRDELLDLLSLKL